jgi:hypothetical protein
MWMTKADYDETGPGVVHRKCFGGGGAVGSNNNSAAPPPPPEEPEEEDIEFDFDDKPKEPTVVKSAVPLENTNKLLVQCGKLVDFSPSQPERTPGAPQACTECGAFVSICSTTCKSIKDTAWTCEFCGTSNLLNQQEKEILEFEASRSDVDRVESVVGPSTPSQPSPAVEVSKSSANPGLFKGLRAKDSQVYQISQVSPAAGEVSAPEDNLPMVVFCVDISSSMSTRVRAGNGKQLSRLDCAKLSVQEQLNTLVKTNPSCIPVIITFGSTVTVHVDGEKSVNLTNNRMLASMDMCINNGMELQNRLQTPLVDSIDHLLAKTKALRTSGCTALGPAMATAVGITSKLPGSKIILCTDGCANIGCGSVSGNKPVAFYEHAARFATDHGTTISIITMEGEDCSMENLGTAADITGGQVEIVDPETMSTQVMSMMSRRVVATHANVKVFVGSATSGGKPGVFEQTAGNVTKFSDLTFDLNEYLQNGNGAEKENDQAAANEGGNSSAASPGKVRDYIPVQVQLRYKSPSGDEFLRVATELLPLTMDREEVENSTNSTTVALHGIQRSAQLAQEGRYEDARIQLILTQRLLQRAMQTDSQKVYMGFVVQAEKLDQFMREAAAQEALGVSVRNGAKRDDDASKAMYQMKSVSVSEILSCRA